MKKTAILILSLFAATSCVTIPKGVPPEVLLLRDKCVANPTEETCQACLAADGNQEECANSMGLAYLAQNNPDKAIEYFQIATIINPKYTEAYVNLGVVYYKQYKLDLAIQTLKTALTLDPTSQMSLVGLTLANFQKATSAKTKAEVITALREADKYAKLLKGLYPAFPGVDNTIATIEKYLKKLEG